MNEKRWITWKGRRILVNANGNIKKQYTEKDIKPLYAMNRKQFTRGYELNGIYLLKCEKFFGIDVMKWVINETNDRIPLKLYNGVTYEPRYQEDKVTYFRTFKEGKSKLIELANKKRKG